MISLRLNRNEAISIFLALSDRYEAILRRQVIINLHSKAKLEIINTWYNTVTRRQSIIVQ